MTNSFLIEAKIDPGLPIIRGVMSESSRWAAANDLFTVAHAVIPKGKWVPPFRPPTSVIAIACKMEPASVQRAYRSFGFETKSFAGHACSFLISTSWFPFLTLSGVSEEAAAEIVRELHSCFNSRLSELQEPRETESKVDLETISDIQALRNRVDSLELKLAGKEERIKRLEYEFERLLVAVKREVSSIAEKLGPSRSSDTANELKKQAGRLYARSKQLESEGS